MIRTIYVIWAIRKNGEQTFIKYAFQDLEQAKRRYNLLHSNDTTFNYRLEDLELDDELKADSVREVLCEDKQRQKLLDETYIEWLRNKAELNRRLVDENDIESDFDKMVIRDAEMQEAIADRLEGLICSLIDGED